MQEFGASKAVTLILTFLMYSRASTKMSINAISAFLLTLLVTASVRSSKFCCDGLLCSCCNR